MNDAELLKKASKAAQSDEKLKALVRKIEDGEADFQDMAVYSERLSKLIGSVLADEGADAEAAEKVMQEYYRHINAKEAKVQAALDRKANLHIRPQKAKFPAERVRQAAQSLEDKTVEQEVIERRARNAVANIANSFHDDYIQENAYFRSNAGLRCYVARIGASKCCAWCAEVAGRFEVGSEPSDFWRRHDNCTCQISYENNKVRQRLSGQGKGWKVDSETQRRRAQRIQYKPITLNSEQARELEAQKLSQYRGLTNSGGNGTIESRTPLKISMQFFGNKNIEKLSNRELKKSIDSWQKKAKEHKEYIQNPYPHCPDWDSYDPRRQEGLKKHWRKEIRNFENDIQAATEELKKRGDSDE